MLRRALLVGLVALAALISLVVGVTALVGGLGAALASTDERSTVVRGPVRRIEVDTTGGNVVVVAVPGARDVRYTRRTRRFLRRPSINEGTRDGVLRLHASCGWMLPGPCETSYRLEVPPGVEVSARSTAGNVRLDGLAGSVVAETTAGNVDLRRGRSRKVIASATAGNVEIDLLVRPEAVDASSTAGNADVRVPAGAYSIEAETAAGEDAIVGLVDDPGAGRRLRARTTAGNAVVRAR